MTSRRKKNVDKSSDFDSFMQQTADYLPPALVDNQQVNKHKNKQNTKLNNQESNEEKHTLKDRQPNKQLNKQDNQKENNQSNKQYSKRSTSLAELFPETKPKEKIINTTLQLPQSVNKRLKKLCQKLGKSKNEVLLTLIEALLEEKGL